MAEDLTRQLTKGDIQMANKYTERCSTPYIIRDYKLKQWTTTTHIRMAKIMTIPNEGEAVEQQELSFIACRNAEWNSNFGSHSYHSIQ